MKIPKVIYEDDYLMVLDKPADLVVHNPPGHTDPSVVSFLENQLPGFGNQSWPDKSRPGIVHRIDKDTSGILVIAKSPEILQALQDQFRSREVEKEYISLVFGIIKPEQGKIAVEISRHAKKDRQTTISQDISQNLLSKISRGTIRPAETYYETLKHFCFQKQPLSLVLAMPKTGRTHQIRIHLKHIGFPIIGDPLYNFKPSKKLSKILNINRQFLHATKITFTHPKTNEKLNFSSPLPNDLKLILDRLTETQI